MPRFSLNIRQGSIAYPRLVADHRTIEGVRQEALAVFADLARSIGTSADNAEWQLEVRDETQKLVFRISVCAESLE
jgi:hypothetical protein